jgi:hypothetical protein
MKTYTNPQDIAMILYRGDYWINNNDANSPKCLRATVNSNPDLYRAYAMAGYRVSKIVATKVQFPNDAKPVAVDFSFELTAPNGKVESGGNTICQLLK